MLYIITFTNILKNYANKIFTINSKILQYHHKRNFRNILKQNYLGHIKKGHL